MMYGASCAQVHELPHIYMIYLYMCVHYVYLLKPRFYYYFTFAIINLYFLIYNLFLFELLFKNGHFNRVFNL